PPLNLRGRFLLRRVPLGLTLLPGPLVGCRSARRLLSLRRRRLLLFGGRWSRRPFRRLRLLRRLQRFRRLRALAGLRPRRDPSTLRRPGAIWAVAPTTLARSSRSRGTTSTPWLTGREPTNVSRDTTVTPSRSRRFR